MRTVALTKESTKDILENLLKRSPNNYGKFEAAVDEILNKVKTEGDAALFAYTKEFDKTEISADTIKVTEEEIKEAYEAVDPALIDVIRKALVNIRSYHEKQRQNSFGIAFVWLAVPAGWFANFLISYMALRKSWPVSTVCNSVANG